MPVPPASEALPPVVNVSGYRFVALDHLPLWQHDIADAFNTLGVKGTILLADEGINVALAGSIGQTTAIRAWFDQFEPFRDLWLKETRSHTLPFAKLLVRIRPEIISFDHPQVTDGSEHALSRPTAPQLPPRTLKRWLDDGHDDRGQAFNLLDTRNHYEVDSGGFTSAQHLNLSSFREFKHSVEQALQDGRLDLDMPTVTFCTGGIRCEKAAPWMRARGFTSVYQVEGGVLNYFAECGDEHWEGDCFVFDDRVQVDAQGKETGASLCTACHRAVPAGERCACPQAALRGAEGA